MLQLPCNTDCKQDKIQFLGHQLHFGVEIQSCKDDPIPMAEIKQLSQRSGLHYLKNSTDFFTGPLSSPLSSTSKSYLMLFATQPQFCIGRKANSICFFDNECRSCQHFHSFEIIEELQLFYTVKVLKSQFQRTQFVSSIKNVAPVNTFIQTRLLRNYSGGNAPQILS